jgi:hypothetical protein
MKAYGVKRSDRATFGSCWCHNKNLDIRSNHLSITSRRNARRAAAKRARRISCAETESAQ